MVLSVTKILIVTQFLHMAMIMQQMLNFANHTIIWEIYVDIQKDKLVRFSIVVM